MLNIWGRISSINVRKVVWCAQELGLDFQRTEAGGRFGVVQTSEYLALNPNALVPTIDDGEGSERVTLWESNVIVRYLCAKHSHGKFYPSDLPARFDAERWMDWQQTTLNGAGREAFVQLIRTPQERRSADAVAASVAATEPLLALLDALLAQRSFIAGEQFTMADIPLACEMHRWWGLPLEHSAHPHLRRWYDGIRQRAGARGVLDLPLS
jgi:glutathione S-transferase